MSFRFVLPLLALSLPATALAGPLNPWGTATGDKTLAINPYMYIMPDGEITPTLYASVGIGDKFDIYAGIGTSMRFNNTDNIFSPGAIELFPRYFVTENVGFALHAIYVPGEVDAVLGPEVHAAWSVGRFAFTGNLGWHPMIGQSGFDAGGLYAIIAPEIYIVPDRLSFYLEVDPGLSLVDPEFDMTLVPGFGVVLDEAGAHSLSLGVQVPVAMDPGPVSVGLWYGTSFGL